MTYEDILKEIPLFENLNSEGLKNIAKISSESKYKEGEVIFEENDEATSILVVKSGLIRITKGGEEIEITTVGKGGALGELSFLDNGVRSATATAVEPTLVVQTPFAKLSELLAKETSFEKEFYKGAAQYVSRRLRKTTGDLQFSKEFVAKYVKYF